MELVCQHKKTIKEDHSPHSHRFEAGDLVMFMGADTSANPACTEKAHTR